MARVAPVAAAHAAGAEVAVRPELSVIDGAAARRPLRLVTGAPAHRPTLVPEIAEPGAPAGAPAAGAPHRPAPAVRLTRRGRLALAAVTTLALAALLTVIVPALARVHPATPVPAAAPAVVVVQPGDTLWTIARRVAPDRDARLVVADLRRLNSLTSADLDVGQRLQVRDR